MADLNKVMILGNVGRDPEIRYTANGNAKTEFSVATNRRYQRPDGDWAEETEWFSVVTWGKLAERMSQNVQKGDRIYVEGRMATRSWDGPDGQKRYKTELVADRVLPQGRRQPVEAGGEYGGAYAGRGNGGRGGSSGGMADLHDADMTDPDDLPFD